MFGGWYTEKGCQYRFSFDSAVTSDITLYAKWDRVTTVVYAHALPAPVATPTPSLCTGCGCHQDRDRKERCYPPDERRVPRWKGLLALLAVGAVGFGAAGWLRKSTTKPTIRFSI